MAECSRCGRSDELLYRLTNLSGLICRDCFITYYEKKVKNCVIKYGMLREVKNMEVAVSRGEYSMALARVLSKLFLNMRIKPIHINLRIPGYSDECQKVVEEFVEENPMELMVHNVKELKGDSTDIFSKLLFVNVEFTLRLPLNMFVTIVRLLQRRLQWLRDR